MMFYILKDKMAVPVESALEWAAWKEQNDTTVARTELDGVEVSTVFLSFDHNFRRDGDPLFFETMVFAEGEPVKMGRYFTWAEAEAGHAEFVERLQLELERAGKLTASTLAAMATG